MVKTQALVGDGLLGRLIDASGLPFDGRGPLNAVYPAPWTAPQRVTTREPVLWETGIKVVDLYAPLALGGSVALLAQPGVGLIVFIHELIYRLAVQRGGCAVMTRLDHERNAVQEVAGELRESGVEQHTVLVAGRSEATPAELRQVLETALAAAEDFVARGRDVLLIVDDGLAIPETVDLLRGRARSADHGSLTVLFCFWRHTEPEPPVAPEVVPLVRETQARLVFSRDLALQAIWPTLDALQSQSTLLNAAHVSVEHLSVAAAARALLQRGAQSPAALERERAQKLLLFQAQPFFVAEPFTALPAEFVPREAGVRAFQAILDGAHDELASEALRFSGGTRRPTLAI